MYPLVALNLRVTNRPRLKACLFLSVNVSIGGIKLARDIEFKSATGYTPIRAGSYSALIQSQGTATTQSITVPTGFLYPNRSYAVFTLGNELTVASKVLETRLTSLVDNLVNVMLVHGSADLGTVRIQTIDLFADPRTAPPTRLLASNFGASAFFCEKSHDFAHLGLRSSPPKWK